MSDKPEVQYVATTQPVASRGFLGAVGAHFKKWWWVHLIIFAAVVLIITLPLIYVGYPRIAQSDVNKSTLNITNLVFSNPSPTSIHINQTQILGNKAIYHPTIYAFNATIMLVGATAPLATVSIPRLQAEDGAVIVVDTDLALNNSDAVTDFTKAVLGTEKFELNFYGRPDLKEGPLPTSTVTFNKTVAMNGMNGLKGFELQDIMISLIPAKDGTNMNGSVSIPNTSVITVSMGNVTLDVSVNGTQIGQSYLNDLTLKPGSNIIPLKSTINQTQVISLISGTKAAYPSGVIPLSIVGNSSVYNGVEIPYFTQALAANPLSTDMNVTQVLINSGLGDLAGAL
ncbi:hypothetical protein TCE0_033r08097 [Talaromyces pinophilus]|uniref:Uncharacterized protein n=1 Tax=Talaromyces pinophilus TaxID=128442 RepID=A0A6V8H8V6_TALPI|nr:Protein of unknown function DUF3712 [Penicillium occitanis (nom. inval.)]PCG94722.1 hypothetical protein PENOC_081330 [Penicillium occitanis (nom. inval.)]GAM37840.1 hypothetical protein TCE0_033r08097 [Talaromyces pinophilus]